MSEMSVGTDFVVRDYGDRDEAEVIELLRGSLGGGPAGERTAEYFRWKHLENVFGRSYMIVAEDRGRIIGFRALMRWRFGIGDREVSAVRPVDTATLPEYRGRGVFSTLTRAALEALRGEVDLVFNTPNPDSLRGYLKMGWQVVGEVPVSIRIARPLRFARWLRRSAALPERPQVRAPFARDALADAGSVAELLEGSDVATWGYSTRRSVEYLRWRYADAPLLGYHGLREERAGRTVGLVFFRLRSERSVWGLSVADVIVRPGDADTARRLLARARRSARVAYVATSFPEGTAAARGSRGLGTLRSPRRPTLVANPLRSDLQPDPLRLSAWALSAGDLEVF